MRKEDDDWVKRCMDIEVVGKVPRGPRKTWIKTVQEDIKAKGLTPEECTKRSVWRKGTKKMLYGESDPEMEEEEILDDMKVS